MAYPVASDVVTRLSFGGATYTTEQVTPFLNDAIATWEANTHAPWLEEGSAIDYVIPQGGIEERRLPFPMTTITSVKLKDGATELRDYTLGTEVILGPRGAITRGFPYTYLEFPYGVVEGVNTLVVNGKRGFSTTVPGDVTNAIINLAAAWVKQAETSGDGPLKKVKQDTVEYEWAVDASGGAVQNALDMMMTVAKRYRV